MNWKWTPYILYAIGVLFLLASLAAMVLPFLGYDAAVPFGTGTLALLCIVVAQLVFKIRRDKKINLDELQYLNLTPTAQAALQAAIDEVTP